MTYTLQNAKRLCINFKSLQNFLCNAASFTTPGSKVMSLKCFILKLWKDSLVINVSFEIARLVI